MLVVATMVGGGCDRGNDEPRGVCEPGTVTAGFVDGTTVIPSSSYAVTRDDWTHVVVHFADFPLDPDALARGRVPAVPAEGTLFTVDLQPASDDPATRTPLRNGMALTASVGADPSEFAVSAQRGFDRLGDATGGRGDAAVTSREPELCGHVDYSDAQKSISGAFRVEVVEVDGEDDR